jgi:hypothetical protein
LIKNIGYEEKIGRFGSFAGGAPFGRQPLQLNGMAERKAESAADQAPLEQEPLKPRTNVSCRFLENQLAVSFLAF